MKRKYLITLLTATIGVVMLLTGCGKKNEEVVESLFGTEIKVESNVSGEVISTEETVGTETTETESTEETTETEVVKETPTPVPTKTPGKTPENTKEPSKVETTHHNDDKPDKNPEKPTSEPTLEPTPEVKPEVTPEVTPEPDIPSQPEDTPEPEQPSRPEDTPEPEKTSEPTSEPTPEPTSEPTPEVTPEPEIPDEIVNGESIGMGGLDHVEGECSHDFVDLGHYLWAPTCASPGSGEATCKKCGYTTSVEIPATGNHNYVVESEQFEATCADFKVIIYRCSGCGDSYTDNIYDPNNHVEGGTCYDENGNCYGCGAHIHDVASESAAE